MHLRTKVEQLEKYIFIIMVMVNMYERLWFLTKILFLHFLRIVVVFVIPVFDYILSDK